MKVKARALRGPFVIFLGVVIVQLWVVARCEVKTLHAHANLVRRGDNFTNISHWLSKTAS